jgi:microcystin-dependent protein
MSTPFIGEIRLFGGNFAPLGFMFCHGQVLSIAQNEALFTLIGTQYGGDGQTTFALPDLRGRVPVHRGQGPGLSNRTIGQVFGSEYVTLTASQLPLHAHSQQASTNAVSAAQGPSAAPGASATTAYYGASAPQIAMAATAVDTAGGSQPHNNMAPYLALNYIIAVEGIFPSRN